MPRLDFDGCRSCVLLFSIGFCGKDAIFVETKRWVLIVGLRACKVFDFVRELRGEDWRLTLEEEEDEEDRRN